MKLHGFYKQILLLILFCNSLYGFTQSSSYPCYVWSVDQNTVLRTVNSISTIYNGKTISGKYLTILGKNHTTVIKPYIIIEGIDFLNDTYFNDHINLFNNYAYPNKSAALIYNLYDNDYDVIILDFDNSTDYLQNNAMLLVQLIKDIYTNNSLTEDNFVVMGFSMGGLIARYALTWMEANNQNHHTRLFVSHDAPQKGANFPLGLQELIEDIRNNTAVVGIATNILLMSFNSYAPAASQMLLYHYSNSKDGIARPSDEGVNFFSELYSLSPTTNGYPAIPLKIASSNGNYSGYGQGFNPGDKLLDFNYTKENEDLFIQWPYCFMLGACGVFDFSGYSCPMASDNISVTVRAGFDGSQPIEEFNIYSLGAHSIGNTTLQTPMGGGGQQTFLSGNYSYDNASGSYSPGYMEMLSDAISSTLGVSVYSKENTCFIPTVSALDLNIGINDSFNLNSSQCYTNFDYIYANTNQNFNHFSLNQEAENFIMSHVLANETPRQKYYFTSQNLTLPTNHTVIENEQYDKIVKYTITNNGNFTVQSGGSSSLIAGQSVDLKPGFSANLGSYFNAKIKASDLFCEQKVQFKSRLLASNLSADSLNSSYQKIYDCNNFSEIPNYNPNLKYFNCQIDTTKQQVISRTDSLLNVNISVFPNPMTTQMNISLTELIPINNLEIKVFDPSSYLLYSINSVNSRNLQFNLPNSQTGLLTVQFNFNNGIYIYSRKVLKQ
ncbi:MAG: 3-coathanger stack domain-containing protein [Paludibacter sp.]